jgi:hypothetical protein
VGGVTSICSFRYAVANLSYVSMYHQSCQYQLFVWIIGFGPMSLHCLQGMPFWASYLLSVYRGTLLLTTSAANSYATKTATVGAELKRR